MRWVVPDVYTFDANVTSASVRGMSETYTLNLITRGKDAGFHKTTTMQNTYGAEFGYGANIGFLFYQGDVSTLSVQTLLGSSRTLSGGLGFGANINAGYPDFGTPTTITALHYGYEFRCWFYWRFRLWRWRNYNGMGPIQTSNFTLTLEKWQLKTLSKKYSV
jgi:hypothetical protein